MSTPNPAAGVPGPRPPAPPSEPRQMTSAARILGVFYAPVKTFEDIAREPHYYLCWLVQAVALWLSQWTALRRIGAVNIARQELMMVPLMRHLSSDQFNAAVQANARNVRLSAPFAPLWFLLTLVIVAGIVYAIDYFILGQRIRFKPVMSMVSHAYLPVTLLTLLGVVVMSLSPDPTNLNMLNLLGSNPGYYLNASSTSPALMLLLQRLDIFSLWTVALLGLGIAKVGVKIRVSTGMKIAFGLWLTFIVIGGGIAALMMS